MREMVGTLGFVARDQAGPQAPELSQLRAQAERGAARLFDAGCAETAELVGRMADRLARQELLLVEERARAADLELKLALALTELSSRTSIVTITG